MLVMIVLVPLVILQVTEISAQRRHSMDMEFNACQDYAEALSSAFINYLNGLWDTENAIAASITQTPLESPDQIETYLKEAQSSQPTVERYSWLNPDGIVIASTAGSSRGVSLEDRSYINRIKGGAEAVVSPIIKGRLGDGIIMPVARGIRKNGKLIGIIVAAVDVKKIGMVLPEYRDNKNSLFGILDGEGNAVYVNGKPDMTLGKRHLIQDSPGWAAIRGEATRINNWTSQFDGVVRMGMILPVKEIGWACFISTPQNDVVERSIYEAIRSTAILLIILICSIAAAISFGRRILQPVIKLKNSSDAIFRGDLSVRTNIEGTDELADAGKAFDQMAEQIQKLEISRQLFIRTSVHELKNPMTSIKAMTSLMKRKVNSQKPAEELIAIMDELEKEVGRLNGLLNEIAEAFRAQSGDVKLKSKLKRIDIMEVIQSVIKFFSMSDTGRSFNLVTGVSGPIWVEGDPERLGDVIRNLIGNALKYSPHGTDVEIGLKTLDNWALISVKDQGSGIPEAELEKIFESFYRSSSLNSGDPGGMGLGLYICKDIVVRHGGSVWAENNKDRGSTFYVKLPLNNIMKGE
jgi:Signal transduction histidine kinase